VIDRAADARSLVRELNEHGYVDDDIRILFSEQGAQRLDLHGTKHGWLARLYRLMETAALESKTLREYHDELMQDHFVFMIQTKDRDQGGEVWTILQKYGARRTTFYGRWIVEKVA
jgi:hypothetical protein